MKKNAVSLIRGLGRRLVKSEGASRLNLQHAPVGMLDVERITRVSEPIATIVSRPLSSYQAKV